MTREQFKATYVLQNTDIVGIDAAIRDAETAAKAIYGEAK